MTTWKTVVIAALAALPPTLIATATLTQAIHVETKVDGRLTELLAATKAQASAEASSSAATAEAARVRAALDKERESRPAALPTYSTPKKSGN